MTDEYQRREFFDRADPPATFEPYESMKQRGEIVDYRYDPRTNTLSIQPCVPASEIEVQIGFVAEPWIPAAPLNVGDRFTINDALHPERNGLYEIVAASGSKVPCKKIEIPPDGAQGEPGTV